MCTHIEKKGGSAPSCSLDQKLLKRTLCCGLLIQSDRVQWVPTWAVACGTTSSQSTASLSQTTKCQDWGSSASSVLGGVRYRIKMSYIYICLYACLHVSLCFSPCRVTLGRVILHVSPLVFASLPAQCSCTCLHLSLFPA